MSASFVSSFFINIVALLVALLNRGSPTHDPLIDGAILLAVLANIIFFYAFGTLSEQSAEHRNFLGVRRNVEWPLRVLSNVILLFLPLALDRWGLLEFWLTLLAFYISLIIWDFVVFAGRPKVNGDPKNPVAYDAWGLVCCLVMGVGIMTLLVAQKPEDYGWLPTLIGENFSNKEQQGRPMFLIGFATLGYLAIAWFTFREIGFRVFKTVLKNAFKERY